jgi:muconolactone delta-isomerase
MTWTLSYAAEADMEFLVTMTTVVPDGVGDDEVAEVRGRESAHTRDLAAQGRVLRLWRPPLAPGEWRTIGLFAAGDADELERTLASMPLRVWRSDEVTALGVHVNDPGAGIVPHTAGSQEYLVTFVLEEPAGTSSQVHDEGHAREATRVRELAARGAVRRLWALPAEGHSLGLWQAADPGQVAADLRALPLADWLTVDTVPLTPHPSDPDA